MINVGSLVKIDNEKYVFEVMSIDKSNASADYDLVWLKWAFNKDFPNHEGLPLYNGVFRKELTEVIER